jgi:hypothetical protein
MAAHAKLSASGSSRWLACPGSVKAEEGYKDKGSVYAQEGTCAHELAELVLRDGGNAFHWEGKNLIENSAHIVEREMCSYVQEFVDYVKALGGEQYYEERVDFSDWVPEGFGTADVIAYDPKTKTLHVVDLKYGKGHRVEAEKNTQGVLYALGAYSDYGMIYDVERVCVHIHQPRLDHVSEWSITLDELLRWGEWISERAQLCLEPEAERVPGEEQCLFCKAKATCPALMRHSEKVLMSEFDDFETADIDAVTDAKLRAVLDNKKLISGWLEAVEAHVVERISSGENFEGYKLVEGRSVRQWSDEEKAEKTLFALLENGAYAPRKIVSPAQAEKALGKKRVGEINELIVKPSGKPTLAPASDKRPAVSINADDFDFGD